MSIDGGMLVISLRAQCAVAIATELEQSMLITTCDESTRSRTIEPMVLSTVSLSEDALFKNDSVTIGYAIDDLATDEMPLFFASKPTFVAHVDEKQPKAAKSISSSSVTTSSQGGPGRRREGSGRPSECPGRPKEGPGRAQGWP